MNQIRLCPLHDRDGHSRLVMAVQMAGAIVKHLKNVIHDGHVATEQLNLRGRRID